MDFNGTYPKRITLTDPKLTKLLKEKGEMIMEGRKVSEDIEAIQEEMDVIDKEVQAVEATVQVDDLREKANEITKRFNAIMTEMEDNQKLVKERLNQIVPQELKDKYATKKKEKEELEKQRNKIALKAQKWNDKIIPLGRKLMKPFIEDSYEDFDTLRIENHEVVTTLFSHLDDFKKRFYERKNVTKH